ncbi:heparan-alpha-glucosaminide N-acetyltransferase domain-containing protein [Citricoccus sp.]|uniref:heparan-alpha-glucosaminide N-acetyltransferase domain-containing protein n=1 Tax=Citricoccus sp. TaxID=1978372 RepID=UPI00261D900A|nr:heparan-alpha-glucosaminide N-acetyltransferase domain-containing protein [Citricoccus sp.]HRO30563.1 heparan-alpha-glucosaminide N-acetyltransferase domain-containing protein [Citricoccus sp.]HRO93465.1 heparan-alpha-glucosaminide N-acetyltransferase domain-containing protein [Citricoccus sp.]
MALRTEVSRRIPGVDAARGIALLGMIATHLMVLVSADGTGPTTVGLVFAGKSSALFATLAGVGLALLTGGAGARRAPHQQPRLGWDRRQVAVRAGLLFVIGLACGSLDTNVAVILAHYALLFLAALPFLHLGARALAGWAAGWLLLSPVAASLLSAVMQSAVGATAYVEHWRIWHTPALPDLVVQPGLLAWDLLFTGYYPVLQWLGYVLFGLFLGRLRLERIRVSAALAAGGAALAATAFLVSRGLQSLPGVLEAIAAGTGVGPARLEAQLLTGAAISTEAIQAHPVWFTLATPHSGAPLDLLLTCGTSAMVLGVCLLLCTVGRGVLAYPLMPLIGAGSMTLTLYVGHLVALDAFGSATAGWPRSGLLIAYWVGCLVAGTIWRGFGWKGPLEWGVSTVASTLAGPRPQGS